LKDSLNTIWGVVVKPGGRSSLCCMTVSSRFRLCWASGFSCSFRWSLTALLAALGLYMSGRFQFPPAFWQAWDFVISFVVVSGLFAMIFKLLPNVRLRWRDVWLGAVATSLLFTLGKFVIGYYLATSSIASSFGAAGSVVIVLAWIYYSACILFFGAEITKGYVRRFASGIVPNSRAVLVDDLLRARLGLTTATIAAASTPPSVPPEPAETLPKNSATYALAAAMGAVGAGACGARLAISSMTSLAYSWSRRFSRSVSWRGFMSIRQSEPMGWPLGARSGMPA
jgi:membrane protein